MAISRECSTSVRCARGTLQSASFSDLLFGFCKTKLFSFEDIRVVTVTVSNRRRRRCNEHYSASQSQKYSSNLPLPPIINP